MILETQDNSHKTKPSPQFLDSEQTSSKNQKVSFVGRERTGRWLQSSKDMDPFKKPTYSINFLLYYKEFRIQFQTHIHVHLTSQSKSPTLIPCLSYTPYHNDPVSLKSLELAPTLIVKLPSVGITQFCLTTSQ